MKSQKRKKNSDDYQIKQYCLMQKGKKSIFDKTHMQEWKLLPYTAY